MRKFLSVVLILLAVTAFQTGCVTSDAQTSAKAEVSTRKPVAPIQNPGQGADVLKRGMYYHQGRPITQGWNGLPWLASLREFKACFAQASQPQPDRAAWITGEKNENFFGFNLPVTYYFDKQERFIAISVSAGSRPQAQILVNTMLQKLGPPKGKKIIWKYGQVTVFPVDKSVLIRGVPPQFE
ncbi:MAG: hypothetical protein SV487_01255 [Thermodesulfobacteriota bacterium]|nr:hypothetical protein [Thermodesulfobacteriota bacterium]